MPKIEHYSHEDKNRTIAALLSIFNRQAFGVHQDWYVAAAMVAGNVRPGPDEGPNEIIELIEQAEGYDDARAIELRVEFGEPKHFIDRLVSIESLPDDFRESVIEISNDEKAKKQGGKISLSLAIEHHTEYRIGDDAWGREIVEMLRKF